MSTYLLLRDNKQSGPFSFDELKEKGLKAYDLVWIEGRSAAWRYPSEIDELSAFAPVVEEQPFDRFYKKPSQISNAHPPASERTSSNPMVAASVMSGDTSSVPGKRIIYVTLPAGKTTPSARPPIQEPQPVQREVAPAMHEKYLPDHSAHALPALSEDLPEDNPSHNLEDWRAGVEISPRASRPRRSSRISQPVVVVLTVMALLAAGIFIGLSINKSSLEFVKNSSLNNSQDKPTPVTTSSVHQPSQPLAVNSLPPSAPVRDAVPDKKDTIVATIPAPAVMNKVPAPKVSTPAKDKSVSAVQKPQPAITTTRDSLLMATPAIHRESSHRSDLSAEKVDKDVIRNNISNLVSIGASGFTVGTFGGISGLQLTVSNRSVYALDLVVVEVQYIQANKKVFKTENLYFRGIAPGSALMQEAPKSARGIKVQYKITLVNSKELGLSYSAL
jgi:hypothetical protein